MISKAFGYGRSIVVVEDAAFEVRRFSEELIVLLDVILDGCFDVLRREKPRDFIVEDCVIIDIAERGGLLS